MNEYEELVAETPDGFGCYITPMSDDEDTPGGPTKELDDIPLGLLIDEYEEEEKYVEEYKRYVWFTHHMIIIL